MQDRAKEIFDKTGDNEFDTLCNDLRELRLLEEVAPRRKPAAYCSTLIVRSPFNRHFSPMWGYACFTCAIRNTLSPESGLT